MSEPAIDGRRDHLVPACCQDGLHVLRPLIDGLVPCESGLLAEGGHRLGQLVDLSIEEVLPIAGLEIFNLIRTEIPILNLSRNVPRWVLRISDFWKQRSRADFPRGMCPWILEVAVTEDIYRVSSKQRVNAGSKGR